MKRRLPARLSSPRCHPLVPLALAALLSSPLHAEPAPPPAAAGHAATGADTPSLAPLTVSARRREELAQEVPAPVSVVDGATLEARRIDRIEDIQQLLPSTSVAFINPRQTSIAVRGLGNNPANDGLEGSTGLYLDNVYLSRPGMAVFDLLDIEQIELMRGPQGTLFGKNTTAGVLNISTRRPDFTPERSLEMSAGQHGRVQARAMLSGPLTDEVAGRIVVYRSQDAGTVTNLYNGDRLNGGHRDGVRAQMLFTPDDSFSLRLIADYNAEKSSSGTQVIYSLGPGLALRRAIAAGATGIVSDPTRYQTNIDETPRIEVEQGGLSAEANWLLDSGFRLTSITAGRFWNYDPVATDELNVKVLDNGVTVRNRQLSQELRLASPAGGRFDYVVGAFYMQQRLRNRLSLSFGPAADIFLQGAPTGLLASVRSENPGQQDTSSYALFGQGTWHVNDRFDLSAGLRASYELKEARVTRDSPVGGSALLAPIRNQPGLLGAYDSGTLRLEQWSPSALLNASYRLRPDLLGYITLSHGEKSGGVNLTGPGTAPGPLGPDSLLVGPERVNNLDLGLKSTLWDHRVLLNANLFWAEVHGYQTTTLVPVRSLSGAYVQVLTNAGDVRTRGAELDLQLLPLRGLTLTLNASLNDARYRRYDNAPCPAEVNIPYPNAVCSLSGRQVAGAPRWIVNLSGEYRYRWSADVQHYLSAAYAWRSGQDGTLDGSVYSRIPAYGLLDLATGWRLGHGASLWSLSLWARNVLDKRYFPAVAATANGAYTASVGTPRTLGATVRYDF